jgi:hypothetical protein
MDLPTSSLVLRHIRSVDPGPHWVVAWRAGTRPRTLHGLLAGPAGFHVIGEGLRVDAAVVSRALSGGAPEAIESGRPGRHWKPGTAAQPLGSMTLRGAGEVLDGPWGWSGTAVPVPEFLGVEAAAVRSVERRRYTLAEQRGWLDVALFDVGPAVEFDAAEIGHVDASEARLDGLPLDAAFLALDLRRDDVGRFFETFGAPPDLGYDGSGIWADVPWLQSDRRWVSLARIGQAQDGLIAALQAGRVPGADWRSGALGADRSAPPAYGEILADERGVPEWRLDLWQAIEAMAALDLARGAIGFCEAPKEHGKGELCGRPFVVQRQGRRYCSARCQSRVSTRRYARSAREAQA